MTVQLSRRLASPEHRAHDNVPREYTQLLPLKPVAPGYGVAEGAWAAELTRAALQGRIVRLDSYRHQPTRIPCVVGINGEDIGVWDGAQDIAGGLSQQRWDSKAESLPVVDTRRSQFSHRIFNSKDQS